MNEQRKMLPEGLYGVGDTFLISLEVKYITSWDLPISPLCKAADYSKSEISPSHMLYVLWD